MNPSNMLNLKSHEIKLVEATSKSRFIKRSPKRMIGDKAYDSDPLDQRLLKEQGMELNAPIRPIEKGLKPRMIGEDGCGILDPGRPACGSRTNIGSSEFVQIKPTGLTRSCNQRSKKNPCQKIPAHVVHNNGPFSVWIKIQMQ
jgi:hypothetical protein